MEMEAVAINPLLDLPVYVIRRKVFKIFGGEFHIFDPQGAKIMFSRQKAFKLKEDIRLWSADQPDREMLTIHARHVIDFGATYDVLDPNEGVKVGALRRRGFKSMIRDEWTVLDTADQPIAELKEDNLMLALVRRWATNLIPQTYYGTKDGERMFKFRQHFNPFVMKMTLDFTMDAGHVLDRRLGLAAAILLCAIEGRQSN